MKKAIRYAIYGLSVIGMLVLMGFINGNFNEEKCAEIVVKIEDLNRFGFISEGDILEILNREFNTPISQKIGDLNCFAMEKRLNEHAAIERADVFISIDRKLHVTLTQRKPILRVFTRDASFYIDKKGRVMPLSLKYTALVPVANGNIQLSYEKLKDLTNKSVDEPDSNALPKLYTDLIKLSQFIDNHEFWRAQIEQVYVDKESEFELIPRVGNHSIVLGGVDNLETKFNKLMIFYQKGLSKTGWNEYKTINLKFNEQVVCTKRY